jgi:hypothetical protein
MAWVPPLYFDTDIPLANFSYSNASSPVHSLAQHDPVYARQDRALKSSAAQEWVRPDFVVKVDDDSFVMLAELEARLRVALHDDSPMHGNNQQLDPNGSSVLSARQGAKLSAPTPDRTISTSTEVQPHSLSNSLLAEDPLIYWGYLVKRRFMAGELYALSWSLVDWISEDPVVKGLVRGAEDKQTAKWMRLHPRAAEVRWVAERCWMYDHPRSGTVCVVVFIFFRKYLTTTIVIIDMATVFCSPPKLLAYGKASGHSSTGDRIKATSPPRQHRIGTMGTGLHPWNGPDRACQRSGLGIACRFPI